MMSFFAAVFAAAVAASLASSPRSVYTPQHPLPAAAAVGAVRWGFPPQPLTEDGGPPLAEIKDGEALFVMLHSNSQLRFRV